MIPKVIAYCWFGKGEKPNLIKKCIASWEKVLPDYTVIELNEDNTDLTLYPYALQAYEQKKYAFVSDCIRMDWLLKNGGITFDADIEAIRPFTDEMLSHRGFTSTESAGRWISAVIASEKESPWVDKILDFYRKNNFVFDPKKICNTTIIHIINTGLFRRHVGDKIELKHGVFIYPRDYFEAKNWSTGETEITLNTRTVHNYTASWVK